MDVYISADIEGVAGVAGRHQITPGAEDYAIVTITRSIVE
jgi:D-aminopeptidase